MRPASNPSQDLLRGTGIGVQLDCDGFEERIHDLLDARESLEDDPLLQRHLDDCRICDIVLQEFLDVDDSMKLLQGDVAAILARVDSREKERSRKWRWVTLVGSTAALLLLGLAFFPDRSGPSSSSAQLVPKSVTAARPAATDSVVPGGEMGVDASNDPGWFESFSPMKSVTNSISMELPDVAIGEQLINQVGNQLTPLQSVWGMADEIPGVIPMQGTVNATLKIIQEFSRPREPARDPDLGRRIRHWHLLAAV